MGKCTAIAEHGRINLIIDKEEGGYSDFSEVLDNIEKRGAFSWFGDVTDENGKERSGLIITDDTRQPVGLDFGEAIQKIKDGKKVFRRGWNGKGMFVYLKRGSVDRSEGDMNPREGGISTTLFETGDVGTSTRLPCICMKTASGAVLEGWLASQSDMLAIDWMELCDEAPPDLSK